MAGQMSSGPTYQLKKKQLNVDISLGSTFIFSLIVSAVLERKSDHHQRTPTSRNSIFFIKKEKIVFVPGLIVGVFEIVLSLIKVIHSLKECANHFYFPKKTIESHQGKVIQS